MDPNGILKMPSNVVGNVMFAIVVEKGISKREYKVIWVLEN